MTDRDAANSGELSSFLHLTGWRPLLLVLIAGLAGAYGLFLALDEPAQWQARYVLNASRIADDDLTPLELDIFVEEIAQTARFPQVENVVEERLGLVNEQDYEITVNQSAASAQFVDVNVVADDPADARSVAIETAIEAMTVTLTEILGGHEAAASQIQEVIDQDEARITELVIDAGGFTPTVALDIAVQAVITRRLDIDNPPQEPCVLADGTNGFCDVEYNGPTLSELEAETARLAPIEREFTNLDATVQAARTRLTDRSNSVRDTQAALTSVENERENQLILDEVVTEETSRIAGLLSGLLLFAVPAALITIVLFVIYDLVRRKPAIEPEAVRTFDSAGSLERTTPHGALPEARITPLTVVDDDDEYDDDGYVDEDEDEDEDEEYDYYDESDPGDVLSFSEDDDPEDDDPEPPQSPRDRWGRRAGSKAG